MTKVFEKMRKDRIFPIREETFKQQEESHLPDGPVQESRDEQFAMSFNHVATDATWSVLFSSILMEGLATDLSGALGHIRKSSHGSLVMMLTRKLPRLGTKDYRLNAVSSAMDEMHYLVCVG